MTELPEIERPFKIYGILDGSKTFHSGHLTLEAAHSRREVANADAVKLGIKTRYVVNPE